MTDLSRTRTRRPGRGSLKDRNWRMLAGAPLAFFGLYRGLPGLRDRSKALLAAVATLPRP